MMVNSKNEIMHTQFFKRKAAQLLPFFGLTVLFFTLFLNNLNGQSMKVKNVVLVHGAFADGSGWKAIYDILTKKGYNVTIVQNPLSSLEMIPLTGRPNFID